MSIVQPTNLDISWQRSKIAVDIIYPDVNDPSGINNKTHRVIGYNRVLVRSVHNLDKYHSVEVDNMGYIHKPADYTFTIIVPVASPTSRLLRTLQELELPFNVKLTDTSTSKEFKIKEDTLQHCVLGSKDYEVQVGMMPMLSFDGQALRYTYKQEDEAGETVQIPADDGESPLLFGDGIPVEGKEQMKDLWT